ncbi:MAG: hypothetical protein FJY07_12240 [Bacteroidetes bacterium]|nr:hypothetical protein [Bacteroidota bacterium]
MVEDENQDVYREWFEQVKFKPEELQEFPECQGLNQEELENLSDVLFELGLTTQKIMIEYNG